MRVGVLEKRGCVLDVEDTSEVQTSYIGMGIGGRQIRSLWNPERERCETSEETKLVHTAGDALLKDRARCTAGIPEAAAKT